MAQLHHSVLVTAMSIFHLSFFLSFSQGIQVTPNSPCASLCIDNSSLDVSDPNSSSTTNADMVCADSDYSSTTAGQKWTKCMSCLQNSTFSQGNESDQVWFFYNLRYNVDYCVFGYPNASNAVGSSPCQTSTACGPLQGALYDGIPNMSNRTEFAYCSANGTTLTSDLFKGCVACVNSSGTQDIVANSLIALEAGCLQQPPSSEAVGLSGSVFSTSTAIAIVAPSETSGSGSSSSDSGSSAHSITTTTIVVIIVVALLIVAAVSGFAFVCYRKRRGSARWALGGSKGVLGKNQGLDGFNAAVGGGGFMPSGGITDSGTSTGPAAWTARFPSSDHITSPLSFQCRASATSLDEMVDFKTVGESKALRDAACSPGSNHSRGDGGKCAPELDMVLQEQQRQQQVPSASRKKHQKPQGINNTASSSSSILGGGGVGSKSASHLPAIVESPFPSPAATAQTADSIGLRIHSSDFDKKDYVEVVSAAVSAASTAAAQQRTSPPRLHQLKTSFSPHLGSNTPSGAADTPTSSTALLSSSSMMGLQQPVVSQQLQQQPTATYNPAAYSPASYHAGSVYAQSQRGSMGCLPPLHNASVSPTPSSHAGPSPVSTNPHASSLTAANVAAASKRGVYQGWSAMVSAAQQYQQQQLQQQHAQASASLPASAVGSYRERDPASAASAVSVVSFASSNGLGLATMAARQSFSGSGDMSATSTQSLPFSSGVASAPVSAVSASRPVHSKSLHSRSGTVPSKVAHKTKVPHQAQSSQHRQSELVRTDFLPPPTKSKR